MTAETIHTCSYSCERPECIRAQRDELAARLTAETSNARGWVLERLRGVLEHGKMGDKCLIAPDLVTAAIASLSAQQSPAEAQPVAKLVNRKDADGGKTTTFIRPTSLGMDLPPGEYPLHLHPPPSAPVGAEWDMPCGECSCGIYDARAFAAFDGTFPKCKRFDRYCVGAIHCAQALAQQPAAARVDVRGLVALAEQMERDAAGCRRDGYIDAAVVKEDCAQRIRQTLGISAIAEALAAEGVQAEPNAEARGVVDEAMVERATMALLGKSHDTAPGVDWRCDRTWTVNKVRKHMRTALAAALAQRPVAVDVAAAKRAVAEVMSAPDGISVEAFFRIVLEAAVAGQRQEPTTCKHDFRRDEDHGGACCQLCGEVRQ